MHTRRGTDALVLTDDRWERLILCKFPNKILSSFLKEKVRVVNATYPIYSPKNTCRQKKSNFINTDANKVVSADRQTFIMSEFYFSLGFSLCLIMVLNAGMVYCQNRARKAKKIILHFCFYKYFLVRMSWPLVIGIQQRRFAWQLS